MHAVQNLLQQIKLLTDLVLLICPLEIGGRSVDDKFFRNKHKKEREDAIGTAMDSQTCTVFERMLEADWEKLEIHKDAELMSLEIFNVTYNIYCYKNNTMSWV